MGSIARPPVTTNSKKWKTINKDGISKIVKSSGEIIYIKSQFWKDMDNYDLLDSITKIHCPILFINGALDNKVPISEMEAYFERANNPKEKTIIEGADHGFEPHQNEMYKIVIKWFKKYLS